MTTEDGKIVVDQVMGDTIEYGDGRAGQAYSLVTISDDSYCIHDPRYDSNGFSPVEDGRYGYSPEAVDALIKINETLIDAQNKFLDNSKSERDNAVSSIQAALGQSEGDLASHVFSDDSDLEAQCLQFGEKIAQYGMQEFLSKFEHDPELKSASQPNA